MSYGGAGPRLLAGTLLFDNALLESGSAAIESAAHSCELCGLFIFEAYEEALIFELDSREFGMNLSEAVIRDTDVPVG